MKNRRIAILVGVIIIIIASLMAYFFISKSKGENWKEYSNANGYSFKYPDNWEIWDSSDPNDITIGFKNFGGIMRISVEQGDLSQFIEAINKDERNIRVIGQKSEIFAGQPATKISLYLFPYDIFFVPFNGKNFSIWRNKFDPENGFDNMEIFKMEDKILSTFKFEAR